MKVPRLVLLAWFGAASCFFTLPAVAQLNLPNALIEPLRKKPDAPLPQAGSDGYDRNQGLHVPNIAPSAGPLGSALSDAGKTEEALQEQALAAVRNAFVGFQVSAIVGNVAILRRTVGSAASTAASVPAMVNGQIPLPAASGSFNGASSGTVSQPRNESLTLRDGQGFEFAPGTGTYVAAIANGRVIVYYEKYGGSKKSGKRTAVFTGELDVVTIAPKAIVLQTKDPEIKTLLRLQAGAINNTSSGNTAPLPSSPTAPLQAP